MHYEYLVQDYGFASTGGVGIEKFLNDLAKQGWRLIAVVQRVGNDSNAIRHYFEREVK